LQQLNIGSRKQSKLPKISAFKQYYVRKQELVFCAHDIATLLLTAYSSTQ